MTAREITYLIGCNLRAAWAGFRTMTGDDDYERYLARHVQIHPDVPPLDRKAFFKVEITRKWTGRMRCC